MNDKDRIYKKVKSIIKMDVARSSYIGEDDFVSLVKNGITINFHLKHHCLDIENVFRAIKRAQKIVKDRFDYDIKKIEIDIYNSMEEMRDDGRSKSRYASWIAGIYDGRIRVIAEKEDEEPEALYIILTHEIIHFAVCEISGGNCPYWLDEGLAVYISQDLSFEYLMKLKKALREEKVLPIEILNNSIPPDSPEELRQLAYAEASSLAEYLIETYGWDKVKSILFQSARRPIRRILSDMCLNFYLLEQGWKRWVRAKFA